MVDAMKDIVGYWQSRWMTAEKQLAEVRIELQETRCEVDALDYQVAEMQNDPIGRNLVAENQRLRELLKDIYDNIDEHEYLPYRLFDRLDNEVNGG